MPLILTCGCRFLRIVVHSLLLCSGVTWFCAVVVVVEVLLLVDKELLCPGATCNRPRVPFGEGCAGMKDVELCRRVLTTSRGHVTMAPTVPAVLRIHFELEKENQCYSILLRIKSLSTNKSRRTRLIPTIVSCIAPHSIRTRVNLNENRIRSVLPLFPG